MDINRPDILIEKNLVTKEEIESLRDDKVCTINIQYVYDKSDHRLPGQNRIWVKFFSRPLSPSFFGQKY